MTSDEAMGWFSMSTTASAPSIRDIEAGCVLAAEVRRYRAMRCETCKHRAWVVIGDPEPAARFAMCQFQDTELVNDMIGCLAWEGRDDA